MLPPDSATDDEGSEPWSSSGGGYYPADGASTSELTLGGAPPGAPWPEAMVGGMVSGVLGPDATAVPAALGTAAGLAGTRWEPAGQTSPPELADLVRLARRGIRAVVRAARAPAAPSLTGLVAGHLGHPAEPPEVLAETWAGYEHVNVQAAVDAWLAEPGRGHELIGVHPGYASPSLSMIMGVGVPLDLVSGPVSRVNRPIGPDGQTLACVQSALYLVTEPDGPVVLLLVGPDPGHGRPATTVEIAADSPHRATQAARRLRELSSEHNVFRGQLLSFDGEMFGFGESALTFHRRPQVSRDDVVLPEQVLAAVERQVVGIARHKAALLASGQHLKRGLLLYGLPGVGKTHTIRYLCSLLADSTIIMLSGEALSMIGTACSVARALTPALVVLEDVDLIAEDRDIGPRGHPLLFQLLNEMDGLSGDADVAFVLSTNRADLLEPALAARPGRVDQAVELALPDLPARRRLFRLYQAGLRLTAGQATVDDLLDRAEGVTASFLKEWLRRAAVLSAQRPPADGEDRDTQGHQAAVPAGHPPGAGAQDIGSPRTGPLTVTGRDLQAALEELLDGCNRLTRSLLGTATAPEDTRD